MAELRWILLGTGVALILGLWWWETRKARATRVPTASPARERAEPSLGGEAEESDSGNAPSALHTSVADRARPARRPPVIEIPEDAEVDISDFVENDRRGAAPTEPVEEPPPPEPDYDPELDADHRAPWVRTQPMERSAVAPKRESEPEPEPATSPDPSASQTASASRQRIVALRLVAAGPRWSGAALRAAIEAEGLRYGRYSIFHREREDGKSLFYVASMLEPGSFDLATMDGEAYPGISLFAIVPGPVDAPSTFDMLLATARRLAEQLKGQLQDEQGSTLTAQRILNLREELVHFEHLNKRLRRS